MLTWVLLAGAAFLLTNAIVGENGYLATLRLRQTEAGLRGAVASLRVENQRLKEERVRLDSDVETLEQTIREQLGYIHPGEVSIVVHDTLPLPDAPAP